MLVLQVRLCGPVTVSTVRVSGENTQTVSVTYLPSFWVSAPLCLSTHLMALRFSHRGLHSSGSCDSRQWFPGELACPLGLPEGFRGIISVTNTLSPSVCVSVSACVCAQVGWAGYTDATFVLPSGLQVVLPHLLPFIL